jgi:hypothetical protein
MALVNLTRPPLRQLRPAEGRKCVIHAGLFTWQKRGNGGSRKPKENSSGLLEERQKKLYIGC